MCEKYCSKCCNCNKIYPTNIFGKTTDVVSCRLMHNLIFTEKDVIKNGGCEYFNKDVSNEKLCCNCKHFLGGGDWGLSCAKDYYKLPSALTKACDNFEKNSKNIKRMENI